MRLADVGRLIILGLGFIASHSFAQASSSGAFIVGAMQNSDLAGQANSTTVEEVSGPVRSVVPLETQLPRGSILVRTSERKLFYVLGEGQAIAFRVGVARKGFSWSGSNSISRKAKWPDWRPPPEMIRREAAAGHFIPDFVAGGPKNPLGARALYIGDTDFRIHGTDKPWSIGHGVSSGCIRMLNENVEELYDLVAIGARIVVE